MQYRFAYEIGALNAITIVMLGLLINRYLLKRLYPLMHSHYQHHQAQRNANFPTLTKEDFKWALSQTDGIRVIAVRRSEYPHSLANPATEVADWLISTALLTNFNKINFLKA